MTIINSAVSSSRKQLAIEAFSSSKIEVRLGSDVILVSREDFAQAATSLGIEGLAYTPPVKVPTGLGAVIQSKVGTRYVRVSKDNWVSEGRGGTQYPYKDSEIQRALEGGAKIISEGVQP